MMILFKLVAAAVCLVTSLIVWACIVVGADADRQDEKMFEEYQKQKEQQE